MLSVCGECLQKTKFTLLDLSLNALTCALHAHKI